MRGSRRSRCLRGSAIAATLNLGVRPAVVAHRGASAHHPENTLAAFEAAVEAGTDMVEFDVRRSADGALVVTHDPTELTLSEIRRSRPEMPTLDEVLEQLRGRVALEVEIKNVPGEAGYEAAGAAIVRDVLAALRRHAFADVVVASFDFESLGSVREADSEVATGFLVDGARDLHEALELTASARHSFLLPEASAVERAGVAFVDRARELDVCICPWTVDDPAGMERLLALGVDGFETNDPALGVRVRNMHTQG